MVGFLQIIIWLLCIYLIFKGVEIFQIAFVSDRQNVSRKLGIVLGVIMIIASIVTAGAGVFMTELQAYQMSKSTNNIPNLR